MLLHGLTAGVALAATLGAAASLGGGGGLLLHGFTLAAALAAGVGAAACVGAASEPLLHGLGFAAALSVADGEASGAFLAWLQPPSRRAMARAPANRFNLCSSQSRDSVATAGSVDVTAAAR